MRNELQLMPKFPCCNPFHPFVMFMFAMSAKTWGGTHKVCDIGKQIKKTKNKPDDETPATLSSSAVGK